MASTTPPPRRFPKTGRRSRWRIAVIALIAASSINVYAQDIFFTQSGGRGLQNAKMSARVSKVEGETKDLQAEMATIQPFAKKPIISCANTGDKLRWVGSDWVCDSETDPTVQAFAKKALPSCGNGQILSASGSEFNCVNSGYLSAETDPTVQTFAKAPLPNCGTGQVLSAHGEGLTCIVDERGLTQETDPYVHSFARTETAVQNCEAGKVLTMQGNRLECVFDAVGITVETDPKVQAFAKNDIPGYALNACAAGEVLTAVTQGSGTILKCEAGSTVVGPIIAGTKLDDLNDVDASGPNADDVLRYVGGKWVNSDDKIGSLTNNRWCYFSGAEIICDRDIPAPMPAQGCDADEMITWDNTGKQWVCADIGSAVGNAVSLGQLKDVSITTPLSSGMGLTYDGTRWVQGYDDRIARYDTDVRVIDNGGNAGAAQIVVDGVAALTATNGRVGIGTNTPWSGAQLTVSSTGYQTFINGGQILGNNHLHIQANNSYLRFDAPNNFIRHHSPFGHIFTGGNVGISTTNPTAKLEVNGDISATNLRLSGNLYVSGSQSFDGVTFANGGVSATGTISATRFVGDGSGLTGIGRGDIILSGTTFVQASEDQSITLVTNGSQRAVIGANGRIGVGTDKPATEVEVVGTVSATNLHVSGKLTVSGSQSIDGVVFANGGVSATGIVTATAFSGDGSLLTGVVKDRVVSGSSNVTVAENGSVTITTNGGQRLVIGSNGYIYGDTTNSYLRLDNSYGAALGFSGSSIRVGGSVAINTGGSEKARFQNGTGYLGILTSAPTTPLEVNGTISATNLRLSGNLYVSGSQSIDGVVFANGGVSATGVVTATAFYGDGSRLTNVNANLADRIISGTSNVTVAQNGSVTITTAGGERLVVGNTGRLEFTGNVIPRSDISYDLGSETLRWNYLYGRIISSGNNSLELRAGSSGNGSIVFRNDGHTERARIAQGSGYVGIGVTNPNARLDVNGRISATDARFGDLLLRHDGTTAIVENLNKTAAVYNILTISGTLNDGSSPIRVSFDNAGQITTNHHSFRWVTSGGQVGAVNSGGFSVANNRQYLFSFDANPNGAADTGLGRHGAGILKATNGSTGYGDFWAKDISATNLRLSGNLYVSGSQSIDGVVFANGGVSATGVVTATAFYGDGSGLTGLAAGDRIVSGTSNVIASQNQSVTIRTAGSQRIIVGENGNVGIGASAPLEALQVNGRVLVGSGLGGASRAAGITLNTTDGYNTVGFGAPGSWFVGLYANNTTQSLNITDATSNWPGTSRVTFLRTGNVGIGTTAPAATLQVSGSFIVSTSAQTTTPSLYVGTNGRVGIGNNNPGSYLLNVSTAPGAGELYVGGAIQLGGNGDRIIHSGGPGYFRLQNTYGGYGFDLAGETALRILRNGNIGISTTSPNAKLDVYGTISATNFVGDGSGLTGIGQGDRIVSGTSNVTVAENGSVTISTAGGQRVQIGENGSVGIGTNAPASTAWRLVVGGGGILLDNSQALWVRDTGGVPALSYGLDSGNSVYARLNHATGSFYTGLLNSTGTGGYYIQTRGHNRLALLANGNVGISTTNPNAKLEVNGDISATNLLLGGSAARGLAQTSGGGGMVFHIPYDGGGNKFEWRNTGPAGGLHMDLAALGSNNNLLQVFGTISATNLRLSGNLYVSGSQSIDGVVFANGGVSATGTVSATRFSGDGSLLTGVPAGDRIISGTTRVLASQDRSITFTTANADRMIVSEDGNVGIAVANPVQRLHVNGNISNQTSGGIYTERLYSAGASQNNYMAGKLGIGTAAAATLQVSGSFIVSNSAQAASQPSLFVSATNGAVGIGGIPNYGANLEIYGTTFFGGGTNSGNISQLGGTHGTFAWRGQGLFQGFNTANPVIIVRREGGVVGTDLIRSYVDNMVTPAFFVKGDGKVGIATATPTTALEVAGTISASNVYVTATTGTVSGTYGYFRYISGSEIYGTFVGDGSGLSGVTAGSSDRIVSGSTAQTRMVAISDTGYISVTQGGYNTAYFHPSLGLVSVGVSSTGAISGTDGYFSGRVGVGTASTVSGGVVINSEGSQTSGVYAYGNTADYSTGFTAANLNATGLGGQPGMVSLLQLGSNGGSFSNWRNNAAVLESYNAGGLIIGAYNGGDLVFQTAIRQPRMVVTSAGDIGVGTVSPTATLQVSGSFIVSASGQTTTPSLYVGTSGIVGIGTTAPSATLHVSGTIKVAGTGAEACDANMRGGMRRNPSTGLMELCQ